MEILTKILSFGSTALLFVALLLLVIKFGANTFLAIKRMIFNAKLERARSRERMENDKNER